MLRNFDNSAAIAALLLAGAGVQADSAPLVRKSSFEVTGSAVPSTDADVDGSLSNGSEAFARGRDSRWGPFTVHGAGDIADWEGTSFCDFDDMSNPRGVLLYYISNSQVGTFRQGQVHFELASSPPSTLCFNFTDGSSTFEVYSDIVGGTGVFEGATGTSFSAGRVTPLRQMSAFTSSGWTEVSLAPGARQSR